jgi:ABC-type uncharacterized transport system permease subunit
MNIAIVIYVIPNINFSLDSWPATPMTVASVLHHHMLRRDDLLLFWIDENAANVAAIAITFPMLFLSGTFIPRGTMPDHLQTVAKLLPLRA